MSTSPPNRQRDSEPSIQGLGESIGNAIGKAIGVAENATRVLLAPLRLPGVGASGARPRVQPGSRPGIESEPDVDTPPAPGAVHIQCIDYSPDRIEHNTFESVEQLLQSPKPEWARVRWLNIDGLHPHVVHRVMQSYDFHTLAAEDVLHVPQRPKLEEFESELFLTARSMTIHDEALTAEQISFFFRPDLLVTFQEWKGDLFDPIRQRLERPDSRLRQQDAGFLLYALLDTAVDHCFPMLEHYGDLLESLEERISEDPHPSVLKELHAIKRQLIQLRRVLWPMREAISGLLDEDRTQIAPLARTYLRDVYDHMIQIIDILESYREMTGGLTDLYMSAVSNRMNEVMKVLTIMASLFIPITFFAGVFGMNFDRMPELHQDWMYPWGFWAVCGVMVLGMLGYFWHRGWLGR